MDIASSTRNMDHNYPSEFSDLQGSTTQETLASARAIVAQLEADHRAKGTRLSGRIIHLTHYLPITVTLKPKDSTNGESGAPISPPKTPVTDIVRLEAEKAHKTGEISHFRYLLLPSLPSHFHLGVMGGYYSNRPAMHDRSTDLSIPQSQLNQSMKKQNKSFLKPALPPIRVHYQSHLRSPSHPSPKRRTRPLNGNYPLAVDILP
jgi:hypothetical protein